jgi:hypothetical protein
MARVPRLSFGPCRVEHVVENNEPTPEASSPFASLRDARFREGNRRRARLCICEVGAPLSGGCALEMPAKPLLICLGRTWFAPTRLSQPLL